MNKSKDNWRLVPHPMRLCIFKGWQWGRRCLISPRGTVFEIRTTAGIGVLARQRRDFQLNGDNE